MFRIKALAALFVAVAFVSALASTSASAAPVVWMLNGKTFTEDGGIRTANVKEVAETDSNIVLKAGTFSITCTGNTDQKEAKITEVFQEDYVAASVVFTNCVASPANCTVPVTLGTGAVVAPELTLDGTSAIKGVLKPKVNTGTVLVTVAVTGGECATAGTKPISGDTEILAPTGQLERTDQLVEFTQGLTGLLKFGSSSASLAGSGLLLIANSASWSIL